MNTDLCEIAVPDAASLMQSLRAFGYDISTAVADLIDNSITADASEISVQFEWNNGNPWIAVMDNGCGMTVHTLYNAMKLGSKNPLDVRNGRDLGRFGLGLKTASFSQCKKMTVMTKTQAGEISLRCWDLDVVTEHNEWMLLKTGSEIGHRLGQRFFSTVKSGTVVLWENLDRIIPKKHINDESYQDTFLKYADSVKRHIAVVFSSYMYGTNKIRFNLNNRPIKLWDPFMRDNKNTTILPAESCQVENHEVKIQPYILPHPNKLTTAEFDSNAGQHGWREQQGFYLYRNNRLIVEGNWLIPGMKKKEQYRLARIRIDIGNETDSEWSIDVRKSIAVPPVSIQDTVRRIASLAQKSSQNIFRHRGKVLIRSEEKDKNMVWHQIKRADKIGYFINRQHPLIKNMLQSDNGEEIKNLLELIEETVPVPLIITNYTDDTKEQLSPFEGKNTESFDKLLPILFKMYVEKGCSSQEAIKILANTEPFNYAPEKVELFREKEGIKIGK